MNSSQKLNDSTSSNERENDAYSLQEVIESEKEIKEIANAVLGASDSNNCSYDKGYVYRQALYSCITCTKANKEADSKRSDDECLHGVCLACSYECHQNHELVELYTKRNFRCDCGNEKFNRNSKSSSQKFVCKLQPVKESHNDLNKYNHNFVGLYCTCNTTYPDCEKSSSFECPNSSGKNNESTEEKTNDEMIQCSICEDWFCVSHLLGMNKFKVSEETDDDELVCHICLADNPFIWCYQGYMPLKASTSQQQSTDKSETVSIESSLVEASHADNAEQTDSSQISCFLERGEAPSLLSTFNSELKRQQCCILLNGWREALCRCTKCLEMYKVNNVEYILDKNDTIKHYEDCGDKKLKEEEAIDENKLLSDELGKMDRIAQVDFLSNLNDFKQELRDFLSDFAKNSVVVKRENILQFFEGLKERKKRKLDDNVASSYY